jgi:hypothetical protein
MNQITGFLASLGAKHVGHGEWEFPTCHWCGGTKCSRFNVDKLIGVCYKCPRPIRLKELLRDIAGDPSIDLKQFVEDHIADERRQIGFEEAILEGLYGQDTARATHLHTVELPAEYRSLDIGKSSVIGKRAVKYLHGRGFNIHQLTRMGFGYCADGPYDGRIIIPFYENGELVYWQARDFTGLADPKEKIKNPTGGSHGKSDVLFNYDRVRMLPHVVMVESWGSALATGAMAFAINGKSMSEVQMYKILAMNAESVVIFLDSGTQPESWHIAKTLSAHGKSVFVANLLEGDPNEVTERVRLRTIAAALPYTVENHIRALAGTEWDVFITATATA